ncbi:hypothetical protein DP0390 [Desulfotalea psychrophila LSv54]|uniref:Alpha/beta hydrolase n=2 Tax=Desulfotalea psychrophila TaxID=84980 RepID=Q6ARA5_DESPS|nr:hypothetical protein DP0390 [Desulfotalea psychrophila LSv54]
MPFRGRVCLFAKSRRERGMKVYFAHGKESGPWGSKIKRLALIARKEGLQVESIDYSDLPEADARVERLVKILRAEEETFLLVGSSMGAYVSLVASERVDAKGLFLLAPALYMSGYERQTHNSHCQHIEIVHGWSDDIIPASHSIKFAEEADCSLHLISGDHRLNSSLVAVERIFSQFLSSMREMSAL